MAEEKKEVLLTAEGLQKLKEEYEILIKEKRPEIIIAIKEARELGDLSENAEYSSAREEQGKIEARIKELEYMFDNFTLIRNGENSKVQIGSTVVIEYIDSKEKEEYSIVGSLEADPFANKISNESPIATAIMNHKIGDIIDVESPNGSYKIKIVKIA